MDCIRTWSFSAGLSSHCSAVTLSLCKPKGLLQLETVLFYSRAASLWLQAGTGHVNHRVRAGLPASTGVTKRAPQGRARRPDASSKVGVRTIPKETLPQKDFCSSGVLDSFRETISESQGDLLGIEGWTKLPFLVACVQADSSCSLIYVPGAVPTAVGLMADAILERNREQPGEFRGSPGTVCKPGGAVSGASYNK